MSHNDGRSLLEKRQDELQRGQDVEDAHDDFPTPTVRSPQPSGYSQLFTTTNGSSHYPNSSTSYNTARQPISEAVTSAFGTTNSNMSPELIQLITQNVIQQLQAHKTTPDPAPQAVQPPTTFEQPDNASPLSNSPTMDRSHVYTPPSPHRADEQAPETRSSTAVPATTRINAYGYETAHKRDVSPFSRASNEEAIMSDTEARPTRPDLLRRLSTDPDATVLEKHWGKMFDDQGQSTDKLSTFLRGIAVHLIEDCEPKGSLVITPDKMQKFYEDTKLEEHLEVYPWQHIFDDKTSSISRLLRESDIKVQHHLVQAELDSRPDIPGLTPHGFAAWITLMIRAHPDHEYERLTKTLRMKGINDPDDRTRRFPAAISRRLFPALGNEIIARRLAELMATHCKVNLASRHNSTTVRDLRQVPPAPTVEEVTDEGEKPGFVPIPELRDSRVSFSTAGADTQKVREAVAIERTKAPSEVSTEDDMPTPQPPLERERKPYVAQAGAGKNHDVISSGDEKTGKMNVPETNNLRRTKSVSTSQRPQVLPPIAVHQRAAPRDETETRARSTTVAGAAEGTSMHRTRSNSSYGAESQPFRRVRSNSTYANEAGPRYHAQRSPSYNKGAFFDTPRASAPDSVNYPAPANYQPQPDRYEYTRSSYDQRDPRYNDRDRSRDRAPDPRSSRPRNQTMATGPDGRAYPEDYYRQQQQQQQQQQQIYANGNGAAPAVGGPYQYPPNAYKDSR